jgi:hypothetical protein
VKMNRRWLAVALLLTSISIPATLFANTDGNRIGSPPPILHHPSPLPPDGNPWPHMTVADGNPWPHMTVADGNPWLRTAATDSAVLGL